MSGLFEYIGSWINAFSKLLIGAGADNATPQVVSKFLRKSPNTVGSQWTAEDSTYFVNELSEVLQLKPNIVGNAFSKSMDIDLTWNKDSAASGRYTHLPNARINLDPTDTSDVGFNSKRDYADLSYKFNIIQRKLTHPNISAATTTPSSGAPVWHETGHSILDQLFIPGTYKHNEDVTEWIDVMDNIYKQSKLSDKHSTFLQSNIKTEANLNKADSLMRKAMSTEAWRRKHIGQLRNK